MKPKRAVAEEEAEAALAVLPGEMLEGAVLAVPADLMACKYLMLSLALFIQLL